MRVWGGGVCFGGFYSIEVGETPWSLLDSLGWRPRGGQDIQVGVGTRKDLRYGSKAKDVISGNRISYFDKSQWGDERTKWSVVSKKRKNFRCVGLFMASPCLDVYKQSIRPFLFVKSTITRTTIWIKRSAHTSEGEKSIANTMTLFTSNVGEQQPKLGRKLCH